MQIMILGLVLWTVSHVFKRLAPGLRARLGEVPGKLLVTVLSLAAVVLMVVGFRRADFDPVYTPLPGMGHLNNLLMLFSVYLFGAGKVPGVARHYLRHPMLTGVVVWAVAHLLVNGDLASVVLFGWLGVWALVSMLLINMQERWKRPLRGRLRADGIVLAVAVVLYGVIAMIHIWLGHNPFLGTYG
ncbi:NnrU family protein [Albidovulum sp.]|uniref:NnrU family protein n=1 Tax=Albidovulum sp. TaxID=1872424 RepID=UPI001E12EBAC|nr:NnrU family protein [Paracoccaceae bacterium]